MLNQPPNSFYIDNIAIETFNITIEEARALNYLLRLYGGQMKEHPVEYEQILRLINGLGLFVDKQDDKR